MSAIFAAASAALAAISVDLGRPSATEEHAVGALDPRARAAWDDGLRWRWFRPDCGQPVRCADMRWTRAADGARRCRHAGEHTQRPTLRLRLGTWLHIGGAQRGTGLPGFHARSYWRAGPIANWLLGWGVAPAGRDDAAATLRQASLDLLAQRRASPVLRAIHRRAAGFGRPIVDGAVALDWLAGDLRRRRAKVQPTAVFRESQLALR
jgi:hypothetical protein